MSPKSPVEKAQADLQTAESSLARIEAQRSLAETTREEVEAECQTLGITLEGLPQAKKVAEQNTRDAEEKFAGAVSVFQQHVSAAEKAMGLTG